MKRALYASDFVNIFPRHAHTVHHGYNKRGVEVISGHAPLSNNSHRVNYIYDTMRFLLLIFLYGENRPFYTQHVNSSEGVKNAFSNASDFYTLMPDCIEDFQETDFWTTYKGKRILDYSTSKKAIPDNHRGQKGRWKDRRAMKDGCTSDDCRFRGKPFYLPKIQFEDDIFSDFLTPDNRNRRRNESDDFLFLAAGMDVLLEKDGVVGAISYNPRYLGYKIIRAA